MSKNKPEVGDVWIKDGRRCHIRDVRLYPIEQGGGGVVFYVFLGRSDYVGIDYFLKHFTYLGKSKANINDLFEVEDD